MQTITLEKAQSQLAEILANLAPGEEVVLTHNGQPAATLRGITPLLSAPEAATQVELGNLSFPTVPAVEAQDRLADIVEKLGPDAEVVLRSPLRAGRQEPRLGALNGTVYMAPEFDEIPEGFEDYLPRDCSSTRTC